MSKRGLMLVASLSLMLGSYGAFGAESAGKVAAKAAAPTKNWSVAAGTTTVIGLDGTSKAALYNDHYVSAGYKILPDVKASLTVPFSTDFRAKGGVDLLNISSQSVSLSVSKGTLYELKNLGVKLSGGARLYLPGASRYTAARADLSASKKLGKLGLGLSTSPRYYFQKHVYKTAAKKKLNTQLAWVNALSASYPLTSKLSLSGGTYLSSARTYKSRTEASKSSHTVGLDTGLRYSVNKHFSVAAGLNSEAPTKKFELTKNSASASLGMSVTF